MWIYWAISLRAFRGLIAYVYGACKAPRRVTVSQVGQMWTSWSAWGTCPSPRGRSGRAEGLRGDKALRAGDWFFCSGCFGPLPIGSSTSFWPSLKTYLNVPFSPGRKRNNFEIIAWGKERGKEGLAVEVNTCCKRSMGYINCFMRVVTFSLHSSPVRQVLLLPLYKWGNWGLENEITCRKEDS